MRKRFRAGASALSTLLPAARRTRAVAGLVAVLTLAPGAAGTALAQTGQPRTEQRAAVACNTTQALTLMGNAVGMLPGSGQVASLFGALASLANLTGCDGITIDQITAIANAQAKLVYEDATLDAAVAKVENQINQFTSLKQSFDELISVDSDRTALVGKLDTMWRLISDNEDDVTGLSFNALPALASIASLKLSVITAGQETETLSLGSWRDFAKARVEQAQKSVGSLNALESELNGYVNGRFRAKSENMSYVCNSRFCTRTYRLFAYDSVTGGKSAVTVLKDVAGKQDPGYDAAWTKAVNAANAKKAGIRDPYLTPGYKAIRAGLQAHAALPVTPLFQLREARCNSDQYMILQSVTHDFLTVTARDGVSDGTSLWLLGDLDYARTHDGSQFKPVRFGSSFFYQIRGAELTMHADGGSQPGNLIRLHGDRDFAEHHPESLFQTYINANNELIFKVSDQDLTIGLSHGEHTQSQLVLDKPLAAAINDKSSRFRYACYPNARR